MKIVAVTTCPTGVAHTYMAKAALEKGAKRRGHSIKVETQGAMGIENEITKADLEQADVVILAIETAINKMDRFKGYNVMKVTINQVIGKNDEIFEKLEKAVEKSKEESDLL